MLLMAAHNTHDQLSILYTMQGADPDQQHAAARVLHPGHRVLLPAVTGDLSPHSLPSYCHAQGCEGGFPYLVAGRYAKDYGAVAESCSPYVGKDGACSTQKVGPQVSP